MEKNEFGYLKTGEKVYKYSLESEELKISILNYGGIITEIIQKDRNGNKKNIVLGFSEIIDYEEKSPYFGCITGRVAGRIKDARFYIDEKEYKLPKNSNGNCIHGGIKNLSKRVWKVSEIEKGIELSYLSKDLEEGFPGNVEFKVRYTLNGNKFKIEYIGETDKKTYMNLTNHTYFNLSGGKEKIYNHKLYVEADRFLELDSTGIPTGIEKDVLNTPFDRRGNDDLKNIEDEKNEDLIIVGGGIDHPYILKNEKKIELYHRESGRKMTLITSEPSVVVYTGNSLGEEGFLNNGEVSKKHMGICLETQDFPNMVNRNIEEIKYIMPEKKYNAFTEYVFSID